MNSLVFVTGCLCAGTGCGGHLNLFRFTPEIMAYQPIGWQGAAQHTYTVACDGLHEPGPCPTHH